MMTSVTLPSTSGPLHGGYQSVADETTSSEPEFEVPRPVKRCLGSSNPLMGDSCKKRRKQSTPVRISAAEAAAAVVGHHHHHHHTEGKPCSSTPEPSELQCLVCQLCFNNSDQLQNHIVADHTTAVECKKEPEEFVGSSLEQLAASRPEVPPWMGELSGKETWINSSLAGLPFSTANPMFILPQFPQPENMPRQPIRIFNPDAYCDLCNKEFCNKYFLKTHKANKHGIYSDPPSSESLGNNASSSFVPGTLKLPATSVPSVEKTEKVTVNPFSNIFPNQFSNKFPKSSKSHHDSDNNENVPNCNGFSSTVSESDKPISDDQPIAEESSPRATQQTESTSFQNDSTTDGIGYYISQSKVSPGNDLDIANRLRRFGVMNPKAFCEICCKEYCNKYFLRTHKMKRHGIYIPDERDKDTKLGDSNFLPWQNNMQTSPLNLIMTEQSNTDRKTTSPPDISCDICGIKFQNIGLSQLHNVSVHAKNIIKEEEHTENFSNDAVKKENDKSLNAEAISEDLQKLQTMILQLNELDVSKRNTTCDDCNKEFENRYFLHAHMMTEHGILLDDVSSDVDKPVESENISNNNTVCDICGKDVQNVEEMKKHVVEFHSDQANLDNLKEDFNNGLTTPEKNSVNRTPVSGSERRISINVTPTSSYCDICNKELCNKYFMKTHMQRMHGIEIENGAQIGGVICDICNKELCSKYFLRVHKHNTHGIVEYGTSLLQPRKSEESTTIPQVASEPDPALKPADLADLSHRYFTHFTEVCSICSRRFRSTKWLKAHLLSDHGQVGAEKWAELEQQLQQTIGQHSKTGMVKNERASPTLKIPNGGQDRKDVGIQNVLSTLFGVDESSPKNYQCSFCPFTTPLLPLLFVHERSHSMSSEGTQLKCPVCGQNFVQPELLQHHMFAQHPFLPLPPFFNGNGIGNDRTAGESSTNESDEENKGKKRAKGKRSSVDAQVAEVGPSLKDMAKRVQVPAVYALPQGTDEGYVMQAFLVEEAAPERRVGPAVVFLPVFQKQPAPLTVTFTLTPA